jgi:magnesium transporter
LPKETSEELLDEMPGQEADDVRELLEFDPATAGGMMNTEFLFVGETSTKEEVLTWMREQELNLDQTDTIVLLDTSAEYCGVVPVARLLLAASEQRMNELKVEPLLSLPPSADEKEVFELFDKYNLRMLTIIDKENRPIGAITVDDVVSRLLK